LAQKKFEDPLWMDKKLASSYFRN